MPILTTKAIKSELVARLWAVPDFPGETDSSDITEPEQLAQLSMLWAKILREQRTPNRFGFNDISTEGMLWLGTPRASMC